MSKRRSNRSPRTVKPDPSPHELRQLLRYEHETGKLFWRERPTATKQWNERYAGKEAFTASSQGGNRIGSIHGRLYRASRVIWAMVHGEWPKGSVLRRDKNVSDNKVSNLKRPKSQLHPSPCEGVIWSKSVNKWRVEVVFQKKTRRIGYYDNVDEAVDARRQIESKVENLKLNRLPWPRNKDVNYQIE